MLSIEEQIEEAGSLISFIDKFMKDYENEEKAKDVGVTCEILDKKVEDFIKEVDSSNSSDPSFKPNWSKSCEETIEECRSAKETVDYHKSQLIELKNKIEKYKEIRELAKKKLAKKNLAKKTQ